MLLIALLLLSIVLYAHIHSDTRVLENNPLYVSLQRDEDTLETLRGSHIKDLQRYASHVGLKNEKNYQLPLPNLSYRIYYGTMLFGSNKQPFITIFDTGSNDLWVSSANCTGSDMCTSGRRLYNATASNTYIANKEPFGITYGSGGVAGYLSQDTAWVAEIPIKNQTFGEIQQADPGIIGLPFDCLCGMAWPFLSAASSEKYAPFVDNLFNQYPAIPRSLSFHLRSIPAEPYSRMYIGEPNGSSYTGQLQYFDITFPAFWSTGTGWTSYAGRHVNTMFFDAIFDTGSTFLTMPEELFQLMVRYTGAIGSEYEIPCERVPNLGNFVLRFGPNQDSYPLTPQQYTFQNTGTNKCYLGFRGWGEPGNTHWVLGLVFLRAYYSVFDYDNYQIGLAPAVI